jgi:putative SOS response-associated peptidase YedK
LLSSIEERWRHTPNGSAANQHGANENQADPVLLFVRRAQAGPPDTNIRNTSSPHWRGWLKPEYRCLVAANSFAEYAPEPNPETKKTDVVWLALNDDRPLFAPGIWTTFNGDRGARSRSLYQGRIRSMVFSRPRRTRS